MAQRARAQDLTTRQVRARLPLMSRAAFVRPSGTDSALGPATLSSGKRSSVFAPLRHRDFALFWVAAVVSNSGSWMQSLAVPFVVYKITNSHTWLGVSAMSALLPSVLCNSVAGALADRFQRRKLLLISQSVLMVLALTMWAVWMRGDPRPGLLVGIVALSGAASGINMPVWQSFIPSLVPQGELVGAIRLNSMQFALARSFGPFLAGSTLHWFGPGAAFMVNAVTYLVVIAALVVVRPTPNVIAREGHPWRRLADGWRYVMRDPRLRISPLTIFWLSFFGFAFVQLAAAIAKDQFHRPEAIGTIVGSYGVGSVLASLFYNAIVAVFRPSQIMVAGSLVWAGSLVLIAASDRFAIGIAGMALMGFAHVTTATTVNTSLQVHVDDAFRGRALAIYMQGVLLGSALGAFSLARFADRFGMAATLRFAAAALATFILVARSALGLRLLDTASPNTALDHTALDHTALDNTALDHTERNPRDA